MAASQDQIIWQEKMASSAQLTGNGMQKQQVRGLLGPASFREITGLAAPALNEELVRNTLSGPAHAAELESAKDNK